jgi:hypothetical protein
VDGNDDFSRLNTESSHQLDPSEPLRLTKTPEVTGMACRS